MESRTFEYPMIIREFHLDTFGHVNNATYLEIYEEARWQFITENGYGLKEIKTTGLGPVILDIRIRFIKELKLREAITIFSKTTAYHSKVGTIQQWIIDSKGNKCSDVEMSIGLFDTTARKLVKPTPEWLKAIC
ncbi:thioesterase family protein [Echinicola marina]|nr:thioesterase family protein [Echinicola marina]